MMLHDDLLPSNATPLEQELARLSGRLDEIDPAVIESIWDAWRCPVAILDHLAAALSVDAWDDGWPEVTKRQAVADSPRYHRLKGTRAAVELLLGTLGYSFRIIEWWETIPWSRRGTFRVLVDLGTQPAAERYSTGRSIRSRARQLVAMSKPKSRAVHVGVGEAVTGPLAVGVGVISRTRLVISPYRLVQPNVAGPLPIGIVVTATRRLRVQVVARAEPSQSATGALAALGTLFMSRRISLSLEAA